MYITKHTLRKETRHTGLGVFITRLTYLLQNTPLYQGLVEAIL